MNKKGYLRMLEAIISIVIIFGAVLVMLPKKPITEAAMPPEIDSTISSVLTETQNNEYFRTCLLLNNDASIGLGNSFNDSKTCLKNTLDSALPVFTQWAYGFAICPTNDADKQCALYDDSKQLKIGEASTMVFPAEKSIYTKSTVISVPDAVTRPFKVKTTTLGSSCCNPSIPANSNGCELNENGKVRDTCVNGKTITIYVWENL